jgi:hypothetical protein
VLPLLLSSCNFAAFAAAFVCSNIVACVLVCLPVCALFVHRFACRLCSASWFLPRFALSGQKNVADLQILNKTSQSLPAPTAPVPDSTGQALLLQSISRGTSQRLHPHVAAASSTFCRAFTIYCPSRPQVSQVLHQPLTQPDKPATNQSPPGLCNCFLTSR